MGLATRASNVQWRFSTKLFATATSHAITDATRYWMPSGVHADRVDGQVDGETEPSDQAEAHKLEPVGGTAHAVQQTNVRA